MVCRSLILLACCIGVQMVKTEFTRCQSPGKFVHSEDRSKYHDCHFVGDNKFTYFLESCPKDTCFDGADQTCNLYHCDSEQMPPAPPSQANDFECTSPGKFPHVDPDRRGYYYKCINANGKLYFYEYQCLPTKACFDVRKQACQVC